jgi:soluble lytic murein transglycosylase-like protein
MGKNHRTENILFVITSCLYLLMMAVWVSAVDQAEILAANAGKNLTAAAVEQDLIDAKAPKGPAGTTDTEKVDWISVRGKTAEAVFHPIIEEAANQYDVEPELIKAIIWAESSFNPNAISRKGAVGLMQVMPSTARGMGIEDFSDPESNIDAGVRYFKQLMVQFEGDAELALAAYNAGSRNVRHYKGVPPFETTRFYVKKVFEYYNDFKDDSKQDIDQI